MNNTRILQEILGIGENIGTIPEQNKIKIKNNTWPIRGDVILREVKYEDDNKRESLRLEV
jgi:hypothetical protein